MGLPTTVADARFAKPLDEDMIRKLVREHEVLITIEEASIGGFGAFVLQFLAREGFLDGGLKVRTMHLPDEFVPHGDPKKQYEYVHLMNQDIVRMAVSALGDERLAKDARIRI